MDVRPSSGSLVRSLLRQPGRGTRQLGRCLTVLTLVAGGTGLPALLGGCAAPPHGTVPVQTTEGAEPAPTSTSSPPATGSPDARPSPPAAPAVVATAQSYLGTPYRYGGASRSGMDCSGLVYRVFRRHGVQLPRTSAEQFQVGEEIAPRAMQSGDLVFFDDAHGHVNHVGIYLGQGRFIHASTGQHEVRVDSLRSAYFQSHFVGARRVAPASH